MEEKRKYKLPPVRFEEIQRAPILPVPAIKLKR
jgi:hypothetical protein